VGGCLEWVAKTLLRSGKRVLKRVLKRKLLALGKSYRKRRSKILALVSTPTTSKAEPGCSLALTHIVATERIADHTTRKRKSSPHIASPPKRTRVNKSRLRMNGKLKRFRFGGSSSFPELLMQNNQAYFDRTRYIPVLEDSDKCILFCRPRRFGKSLTISMLEHFHGLQYADQHQTLYQVCDLLLNYLDIENLLLF
jgi:hypothetical protein